MSELVNEYHWSQTTAQTRGIPLEYQSVVCINTYMLLLGCSYHNLLQHTMKGKYDAFSLLFVIFAIGVTVDTHIYKRSAPSLELYCVDSALRLRGLSDIECAIMAPMLYPYNYAFAVREGRCYICRTTGTLGPHRADERLMQGPHYLTGTLETWLVN